MHLLLDIPWGGPQASRPFYGDFQRDLINNLPGKEKEMREVGLTPQGSRGPL